MANRTKLGRRIPALDTCHKVTIFSSTGEAIFDLLLYGLLDDDIYLVPNPFVSAALNRRGFQQVEINVSPFFVERIR